MKPVPTLAAAAALLSACATTTGTGQVPLNSSVDREHDNAPVIEYLFDEPLASGSVLDSAGNHHARNLPGPNNTAPEYGPGYTGTALALDGDGDFLNIGDVPPMRRYTIMAWIKPLPPIPQTFVPSIAEEVPRANNEVLEKIGEYWLNVRDDTRKLRAGGRFVNSTEDCDGSISGHQVTVDSSVPIPRRKWTHVAMTYSGSHLTVFVNGKVSGKVATPTSRCDSAWPFVIGAKYSPYAYAEWSKGMVTNNFHGAIDCFKVFDSALSPARVAAESKNCGNP